MLNPALPTVETIPIAPHAGKVIDALSRIGYKIEEAMADLIDNSVDARASNVLIRFVHDGAEIRQILVADDGKGMSRKELLEAVQFGSARVRDSHDLGKFGMGLKTAAFSQGRSLTVISRKAGRTCACRWTVRSISSGWNCEVLSPQAAGVWLDNIGQPISIGKSGTLIVIDELDHIRTGNSSLEATVQKLHKKLSVHLGIVFHRILQERVSLYIDAASTSQEGAGFTVPVEPLDPFGYPMSGDKNYPKEFVLQMKWLPGLKCRAHIWLPNQTSSGYLLGGGNVVKRQGFYFYRNGRLIQAGGWNGWRENESDHHFSLARVQVELTPDFDSEFRINVQKSVLDVPEAFRTALSASGCPMAPYLKRAEDVYNRRVEVEQEYVPVPGKGFGEPVRRKATSFLAGRKAPTHPINILWRRLESDRFFEIDREEGNIILDICSSQRCKA